MKSYYAYIRVSTAKQGEHGSSLQEQRSAIEAYAARAHLSIAEWFEERETAAKQGRYTFSKMLKALEKGDADGVVIHKIDRSARNLKDWANLGDLIDRGVDVHFAHDSVDLRSRGGRLSADIQAVVAADYIRNLREEVRKGFYGRIKQGLFPLPAPIGYLDMGKAKPKAIDPIRGPLVQKAFELYGTASMSLWELRQEMKKHGLYTKGGKPLSVATLSWVLNNPFYVGLIRIKRTKEVFPGIHPPLVTKALFARCQDILRGKTVSRGLRHDFLFRCLVRCATCGLYLTGERHKDRTYYRCHNRTCSVCVREEVLEDCIERCLMLLICDVTEVRELRLLVEELKNHRSEEAAQVRKALKMRIAKCDERLARLTDALIDGILEKELFEARKSVALFERRGLLDEDAELSAGSLPSDRAFENFDAAYMAYSGYKIGNPAEKRILVKTLTSTFAVHGKEPAITLYSPFQELANWRKSQHGAPRRGTPRQRAKQILDIFLASAEKDHEASKLKRAA
jgi:site-specific DNA recombinase